MGQMLLAKEEEFRGESSALESSRHAGTVAKVRVGR